MTFFHIMALVLVAYLLGSIPCGLILTRLFTQNDLLKTGSGNIGANNVRRIAGNTLGLITLLADMAKGGVPVYLALAVIPAGMWRDSAMYITAIAAFIGHLHPLYMRGQNGGKGVATAAGCFVVISPAATGTAFLVYVLMVCLTSRSSVASMTAATFLPFAVHVAGLSFPALLCAGFMAIMIIIRHKSNIQRLLRGEEPPLQF